MSLKHLRTLLATASCFATMTALGHGETYKTIPPLPKITVAIFTGSNEPFEFNTANAAGDKTFWAGKISISKTGVITGSATVETYDINGKLVGSPAPVTIQTGSRISSPTNPIKPINSVLLDEGFNNDRAKEQRADYRADIIVKFSNGFVARGKITYEHSLYLEPNTSTINGLTTIDSWYGWNDSDDWTNISITGPKGHIGFMGQD